MSAFQQNGRLEALGEFLCQRAQVGGLLLSIGKRHRLRNVGGDQRCVRQKAFLEQFDRFFFQQGGAAGRDHNRIGDSDDARIQGETFGNNLDIRRSRQHAAFHGADVVQVDHGVELLRHEFRRDGDGRVHAERILRGQRGEYRATVNAERMERPQVSLYTGIPAAIASGNGETGRLAQFTVIRFIYGFVHHGR